ncbi:MaoC family dehydratase [Lutibacter sp.]|uniref:MaoC family dehydratase n=1 Tax=Lutibacter sp. TaxID=1925666 RepID=UPI00273396E6|nr:MaoC family dehydratase [Lutibacter sp.]MDP3312579.1 MaoC family dehydratase [Lutibacter sp.]
MKVQFKIGDFREVTRVFTGENVQQFAELSNDFNPLHLDEDFASKAFFGKRIVHGMLYASMFSELIATKIPGPGAIYLEQHLKFLKPVYWNDKITARVSIINIIENKSLFKLQTIIYKNDTIEDLVLDGEALIKL